MQIFWDKVKNRAIGNLVNWGMTILKYYIIAIEFEKKVQ